MTAITSRGAPVSVFGILFFFSLDPSQPLLNLENFVGAHVRKTACVSYILLRLTFLVFFFAVFILRLISENPMTVFASPDVFGLFFAVFISRLIFRKSISRLIFRKSDDSFCFA